MAGVLIGFAIIGAVIAAGYLVGRLGILGPHAEFVLGRFSFFVLSPALLFTVLAEADAAQLFSSLLPVSAIASLSCMLVFAVVARLLWRRAIAETTIGSLASGYANANNIGLPIAAYVLGDPAFAARGHPAAARHFHPQLRSRFSMSRRAERSRWVGF